MPPKKAPGGPSKKTEAKKKEKVIEDKTFGLKNKKGNKNQKFIAQVEKQVKSGGNPLTRKRDEELAAERKRKEEKKRQEEEAKALFKPVVKEQKLEAGVDPKSIFCAFFKQGLCKKGAKCKFSHDPDVEKKSAKRNVYADARDDKEENMDDWDEAKLEEVIAKKHANEMSNATDIICKHFLDAVENNKYGWFWSCPGGGNNCKYRHALPPGFVLKKDKKREEKTDEISLEELIENRRAELSAKSGDLTKVTLQTFVAWKKRKLKEKQDKELKEKASKKEKFISGVKVGMSGREMFSFDPKLVADDDDDDEGGEFDLEREEAEDDGVQVHEIKFDEYGIMDDGVDESTDAQLKKMGAGATGGAAAAAVPIDEDLFEDEDLDELEEDMANVQV